ncbi:MAG: FAD-dependent oxidoreductase, partial [Oscillospiraceae bacterium]
VLASLCSYIGIRQTYQIKSRYKCTEDEILSGKRFDDAILNGTYCLDVHHNADMDSGVTLKYLNGESRVHHGANQANESGRWREVTEKNPLFYQIPYRAIIPEKFDNLLMCGRMIDAENSAYGAIRVMVNANQLGEAAGVAAAICVNENCNTYDVDTVKLRELLKKGGSIVI